MEIAEDFVARFSRFWADPRPEDLVMLLTDDVVLVQPLGTATSGIEEAQAAFAKLFDWLPDLRAEVDGWALRGSSLFIEFRLSATLGGRRVEWPVVDRFELRGNKAVKRVSYFDALPLVGKVLKAPSSWPGWWRSGAARPWS